MSSKWHYDYTREGAPYNFYGYALQSLPANKQGLFVVERGKRGADISYNPNRTSKQVTAMMVKAFAGVGEREYKKFLDYLRKVGNTEELPPGFADERRGFCYYLNALELESGFNTALNMAFSIEMERPLFDKVVKTMTDNISLNLIEQRAEQVLRGDYTYKAATSYRIPNDKISHLVRTGKEKEWETGIFKGIENPRDKDKPQEISILYMDLTALHQMGFTRLDFFDLCVFYACLAIQLEGNMGASLQSIFRTMTGKTSKQSKHISESMLLDIHDSLVKLMSIPVEYDLDGAMKVYKKGKGLPDKPVGIFLPCTLSGKARIQGQDVDCFVKFYDQAPLVKIVEAKGNQFIRFPTALLDVPLKSDRQNIVIPPYLLQRTEDTRTGKVRKTILIDDAIEDCNYTGTRARFVQAVEKCFTHWKDQGYIKSFKKVVKPKTKNVVEKFTFTLYPRPSEQLEN